jgi:hypothetical protein
MASTVSALVVSGYVLSCRRGPSELRWVLGVQLAFLSVYSGGVLGDDFGSTRSTMLLLAVALAVLVSGTRPRVPLPDVRYLASTSARNLPV